MCIGLYTLIVLIHPVIFPQTIIENDEYLEYTESTEMTNSTETYESQEEVQEDLLREYDFSGMNQILQNMSGEEALSFGELVRSLMGGDLPIQEDSAAEWKQIVYQVFLTELDSNRIILAKLILLAIITAMYTNVSGSMTQGLVRENGFYITYLVMITLLMSSYTLIYQIAYETVEDILEIMQTLIPTYMTAVSMSAGITSSVVLQDGMVLGITLVSTAVERVVFPMIQLYVILGLVNNLMEQDRFSKLLELLHTMVTWLLKSVLALVVGVNTIKSMLAPVTDSITATALQRGLTVIPGGQAVNAVSGVVIGSGVLIKNAIGVGGMLVLVLAVSVPVIKMTVFILLYKLIAAMLQPIADARMIRGINSVSQGGQLLISTVLSVIVLFLVSIAIIAVSTNVTYYS
jgi:stage III sporulation protein AE